MQKQSSRTRANKVERKTQNIMKTEKYPVKMYANIAYGNRNENNCNEEGVNER